MFQQSTRKFRIFMTGTTRPKRLKIFWRFIALLTCATLLPTARATTATWNLSGGGTWNTGGNWTGGVAPTAAEDSATFNAPGNNGANTVTVSSAISVGSISLTGSSSGGGRRWVI